MKKITFGGEGGRERSECFIVAKKKELEIQRGQNVTSTSLKKSRS
jgi:hypothetical protein